MGSVGIAHDTILSIDSLIKKKSIIVLLVWHRKFMKKCIVVLPAWHRKLKAYEYDIFYAESG